MLKEKSTVNGCKHAFSVFTSSPPKPAIKISILKIAKPIIKKLESSLISLLNEQITFKSILNFGKSENI